MFKPARTWGLFIYFYSSLRRKCFFTSTASSSCFIQVAILQDTRDSWGMKNICHKCNILIHEATLENADTKRCVENGHSTPEMAAEFALSTESDMLVMTHFSQRYVQLRYFCLWFNLHRPEVLEFL